jgi:DNA-binding transcriptional regulator/RsmH inhibitor MraZ
MEQEKVGRLIEEGDHFEIWDKVEWEKIKLTFKPLGVS